MFLFNWTFVLVSVLVSVPVLILVGEPHDLVSVITVFTEHSPMSCSSATVTQNTAKDNSTHIVVLHLVTMFDWSVRCKNT